MIILNYIYDIMYPGDIYIKGCLGRSIMGIKCSALK